MKITNKEAIERLTFLKINIELLSNYEDAIDHAISVLEQQKETRLSPISLLMEDNWITECCGSYVTILNNYCPNCGAKIIRE